MTKKIVHLNHLPMSGHPSSYVEMPTYYDPKKIHKHDLAQDKNLRVLSQKEAEAHGIPASDSHSDVPCDHPAPDDEEPKPAICIGPGFDRPFGDE